MKYIYMFILTGLLLATTPANAQISKDQQWNEIVSWAMAQSAAQNFGRPNIQRECYPADGQCGTFITYRLANGQYQLVMRVSDRNDRTAARGICQSNDLGDIIHCLNFDTSASYDLMKDSRTGQFVTLPPAFR